MISFQHILGYETVNFAMKPLYLPGVIPFMLVAIQAVGAAMGNMICVHNVVAASATVGLVGMEGTIIRRTLVPCIFYELLAGTIPMKAGIVLLTNRMNKIIELNETDMYVRVQPGVVTANLASEVAANGLFYPPDPGSQAVSTIAGNVAENAGGLRGLKYGVTKDYVMSVEFYDAFGRKVTSGSKTVKCVTGYNLAGLITSSEGTLGIFGEITLKLVPPPKASKAMMAEDRARVEELCRKLGARQIKVAENEAEKAKVWEARRAALSALARLKPTLVLEDATVPWSKIPAMVSAIEELGKKYDMPIGTFGHAGDGNLHPTILTDKRAKAHWSRVEHCIDDLFDTALKLGGTLSGEHGIGIAKSGFLKNEVGQSSIDFSRAMKAAIDPNTILNPGKIIGL